MVACEIFNIPTVYQQESGIDFIIGNNFCQLYEPFVQYAKMIILTLAGKEVYIPKITKAYKVGVKNFLESMKKKSKDSTTRCFEYQSH